MKEEMQNKIVAAMKGELCALVDAHKRKILRTFEKSDKGALTVGFNTKLNLINTTEIALSAGIGFGVRWTDTSETIKISDQPELGLDDDGGE